MENIIKKKTKLLKENEIYSKELIKIIEEQKEEIRELEKKNGINRYIPNNNIKNKDNERYINYNDIANEEKNNNQNENNNNRIVLPDIYNNEDKNKKSIENNENEKADFGLNNNEENNNKLNEFKNLMDDLYNNANN